MLTDISWSIFYHTYWILSRWTYNKTYGSCMLVPQCIPRMVPEIILRLHALGSGNKADNIPWLIHSPDLNPFDFSILVDTVEKLLQLIQNGYTSDCNAHGNFQCIHPSTVGPKLIWQCKVNILSIYCNPFYYLLSLECKMTYLVNCCINSQTTICHW
jgi:hypothetical protein